MGGAYYPIGGSGVIAAALIPTIEQAGGRVLIRAKVTSVEMSSEGRQVSAYTSLTRRGTSLIHWDELRG